VEFLSVAKCGLSDLDGIGAFKSVKVRIHIHIQDVSKLIPFIEALEFGP
jgi:hypothetical protein